MEQYRMYHLVMYNISPIQQGIQAYHSAIEYALRYSNTAEFQQWARNDKTVIILNGGTSHNFEYEISKLGTMEKHCLVLVEHGIKFAVFHEPDLSFSTAAIAFLVPAKVWDKEAYPDWESLSPEEQAGTGLADYDDYVNKVIGEENEWMRNFLSQFRLA